MGGSVGEAVRMLLWGTDAVVLVYFFLINSSYLVLIALAGVDIARQYRRSVFTDTEETYVNPFTLPVSLIVPAYNEQAGIVEAVRAALGLRYPVFEVIVVDDGSTDGTFAALRDAFDLAEIPYVVPDRLATRGPVISVHVPRVSSAKVIVVRKVNGGKTDALNTGINLARNPLVCMVDADSILDPDAMLVVAEPFAADPEHTVATGGVVRIANGCTVTAGRVVRARLPESWLPRIQTVEYLRAFLLGRAGWSRLDSLTVISGAFGLFRRDVLLEVGGLDPDCIGEDAELVVRTHRHQRERRRDYRIRFIAHPVSWTEAPSSLRVLGKQRARWQRGLTEILLKHRRMIANPRYGRIGLVAMPYQLVFELLAPLIELSGLVLLPLSLAVGAIDTDFALRFVLIAYVYALLVSTVAIAADDYAYHRYPAWYDIGAALAAAVAENFGYRQLTAWWRLRGSWAALRHKQSSWGTMTRRGFTSPEHTR